MQNSEKVLIVSLGSIGQRHLKNTRTLLPKAQIAVFRQHHKNREIPEGADLVFSKLEDALAFRPQAVIVASPATHHLEVARAFAQQGAHLFLEKPLADTVRGKKELIDSLKSAKSFIMIGYVLRFLPALRDIRRFINSGELGDVFTAHVQVGQYLPDWRPQSDYRHGVSAQKSLGGGALLELSHEIDYSTWLFGIPDQLFCSASKVSALEIDVEDSANIIFEYHSDRPKRIMIQLDFLQRVAHMGLQIVGSKGTLRADLIQEIVSLFSPEFPQGQPLKMGKLKNGNEIYLRQFDFFFSKSFSHYQNMFEETEAFEDWVSVSHAADVLEIVDLAKESNSLGQKLTVQKAGL